MCSCVVAMSSVSPSKQYIHTSNINRRRFTQDRDTLSGPHFHVPIHPIIPTIASAPPSLGEHYPCSSSGSSLLRLARQHYITVHVLLKKHESQFKLSQGELQTHLRAIFHHLRPQDNIKLAVRLESWKESHRRYLVVISTTGRQDTEESIIVGCDFDSEESTTCTIGLVLPVWCDTDIRLDGDGGFHVECRERVHTFKPVSVQAMWSALQSLNRCVEVARKNNYFEGSLYLTWTGFYTNKICSVRLYINEWMFREEILEKSKEKYMEKPDPTRAPVELMIRNKLKQVMMHMDLDNCTSRDIRVALEGEIDMDLKSFKAYIDTEMLTVLGQMDCPSQILDYLYLGSEWNASNLEELQLLGITHILNVTIEIDNFFPELFTYKAVLLYDVEESDLLPHWNHTWKYIAEARKSGGKCLVHCRMGISRSAATVCAYLMKENMWTKAEAIEYVKSRRPIICPNPAFQKQLDEYEGMLSASSHRHNKLFRSRSESSLVETGVNEERLQAGSKAAPLPTIQVGDDVSDEQHDVTDSAGDFDLNRHLLDIASLAAPKSSRPKSWSPDEGRTPYVPRNFEGGRKQSDSLANDPVNHSVHVQNLSEPVELLVTPSGDAVRSGRVKELRQNFTNKRANLRRQTAEGGVPLEDDFAHSEDSVFVHDGNTSVKPRRERTHPRSSSPAALGVEYSHNGPPVSSVQTETTPQATNGHIIIDDVSKSSPQEETLVKSAKSDGFVKGHHKTLSLPPVASDPPPSASQEYARDDDDVTQNRRQSCSDAPTSVKQIVTAIESLHSPDAESAEGMRRSASLPSWRKKFGSGTTAIASERIMETQDDSAKPISTAESNFFIGDAGCDNMPTEKIRDFNSNNNNSCTLSAVPEVTYAVTSACSLQSDDCHEKRRLLSPDVLHMIREIGVHLEKAESMDPSNLTATDPASVRNKKRGVVRQMVREIEKGVRKLTGKSAKSEKKMKVAVPEQCDSEKFYSFSPDKHSPCSGSTFSKPPTPGIDLVTPPPYRTPDSIRATSPGKARFKLSVTVPRIRRTQSERAALKPQTFNKPGQFRSFRMTDSNLSLKQSLPTECTSAATASKVEFDDESTICESSDRRSSSDDTSLLMTSSFSFRRAASSPQLVPSQSASITLSKQNFITSQSTDQVRS